MKFAIIMHMPTRNDASVHRIIAVHPAKSLRDFVTLMNSEDFIVVEELYKKEDGSGMFSAGDVALNTSYIGKVKEFT